MSIRLPPSGSVWTKLQGGRRKKVGGRRLEDGEDEYHVTSLRLRLDKVARWQKNEGRWERTRRRGG